MKTTEEKTYTAKEIGEMLEVILALTQSRNEEGADAIGHKLKETLPTELGFYASLITITVKDDKKHIKSAEQEAEDYRELAHSYSDRLDEYEVQNAIMKKVLSLEN